MPSASLLFLAILAVGTIDELTQPFVNRTASLAEWLADIVGIITVCRKNGFVCKKTKKKGKKEVMHCSW